MDYQQLLFEISAIAKKYKHLNEKTGGYFNIFDIANIQTDEVTICRVISELISPEGSHFQGDAYLKVFFEKVLKIDIDADELRTAKVHREYGISNQRRVDIVIETVIRTIPIEVKIYAGDQINQCSDYYKIARNSNVYYLTLFGVKPSEQSTNGLTLNADGTFNEVTCVSFGVEILEWLDCCLKHLPTIKIASIREIILQFMSTIRKLTNQMEDNEEMEVKELLMKSPDHMRSAIAIESSISEVKRDFLEKVFKGIEKKVNVQKLINDYDYESDQLKRINDFYRNNKQTYPGISYLYKSNVVQDLDIWVRFEIEWGPYVGFCVSKGGKMIESPLTDKQIENILGVEAVKDNSWIYYELLPNDNQDECPDFKGLDDFYLELYDDKNFETFTTVCAAKINEMLAK